MLVRLVIIAFLFSFVICFFIVRFFISNSKLQNVFADTFIGPQKFHNRLIPRIGGFGIFISAVSVMLLFSFLIKDENIVYFAVSSLPAFLAGFAEDITKKVSSRWRLVAIMVSVLIGVFLLNAILYRVDIALIDTALSVKTIGIAFTLVAVAGVANSINIIDGYNGLSSVVSMLILLGLAYVAHKVNDRLLLYVALITAGSVAGFFLWNYPFGKVFLGDGGAYFIGFAIAEISVLLVNRHQEVSAWFPMLCVIYPVFETVFSIYRRRKKRIGADIADAFHLHQLIYDRVVPHFYNIKRDEKLARNSATSPFLWFVCSIGVLPAVIFWQNTLALQVFAILFCVFYIWFYRSIVRFKIGKILG